MRKLLTSVALFAMIGAAEAKSVTSELLALNHAFRVADDEAIENYLQQALSVSPDDPALLNQAMLSAVYQQDLKKAAGYLSKVNELGVQNQTSDLIEIANGIVRDDFVHAAEFGKKFGFLDDDVMQSWALASEGDVDGAIDYLKDAALRTPELQAIFQYETAMLYAHFAKDYEKADEILQGDRAPLYLTESSLYAHMVIKVLKGEEDVDAILDQRYGGRGNWPLPLVKMIENAHSGNIDPAVIFASPQSISAEYLAFVLVQSRNAGLPYQTERLFVTLIPAIASKNDSFRTEMLQYFYDGEEYDDVIKFAQGFQKDSAFESERKTFVFSALMQLDRVDEARAMLETREGKGIEELHSIADGYRYLEEYEIALGQYETLLQLDDIPKLRRAGIFYSAAICAERLGVFDTADRYFREAIALQPDSPDILNYLGYSLVDRGADVEEGLKLIERAVEIDPSKAYIQDSLGWAYFHVGRYEEAVYPLELAVAKMGSDPIVNGHLGDVYWKLGRKREAVFQWERAMKFLEEDLPDMKRADLESRLASGLPD